MSFSKRATKHRHQSALSECLSTHTRTFLFISIDQEHGKYDAPKHRCLSTGGARGQRTTLTAHERSRNKSQETTRSTFTAESRGGLLVDALEGQEDVVHHAGDLDRGSGSRNALALEERYYGP